MAVNLIIDKFTQPYFSGLSIRQLGFQPGIIAGLNAGYFLIVLELAVSGKIPTVKAGNKYLINYDLLCEYLANPTDPRFQSTNKPTPIIQGIRRITG